MKKPQQHQVRIVGGLWKRTPLPVPEVAGLRPTSERVRETVFNWLSHLRGTDFGRLRCLDLFAGTGALGFEAASRGVAHVTMIEENKIAFSHLEMIRQKLGATQIVLCRSDALKTGRQFVQEKKQFDLIFLDPPFQKNLLPEIVPLCVALLNPAGLIYVESPTAITEEKLRLWAPDVPYLQIMRAGKAGHVHYHLLEMTA